MSTFVGHALAGTLATRLAGADAAPRRRPLVALAVVAAVIPDLDIVLFLALRPLGMAPHRGFSHSLPFALASATVLALVASRFLRLPVARLWCVLALAALSHPVLDFLMGAGPPVPAFAPLSDRGYLAPWRVLPMAFYGKEAGAYLSPAFWLLNGLAAALECLIFVPPLVLGSRGGTRTRTSLALAAIVCGLYATVSLYN